MSELPVSRLSTATRTVAELLAVAPLDAGTVVAAADRVGSRAVTWVAVIEWPVEDFVQPGELVLTTGVGCDASMFEQLATEIAAASAAALCISVGPEAPFSEVAPAVRAVGERSGMPIIALPWSVRFADVLRSVVDGAFAARYAAVLDPRARLPLPLAEALLRRDALRSIAASLETMTERAALVLDDGLAIAASGPRAERRMGPARIAAQPERAHALDSADLLRLHARLDSRVAHGTPAIPELDLPPGYVRASIAQDGTLGFVLLLDEDGAAAPVLDQHAIEHAATAVAIEMLRRRAASDAHDAVRGDFLWELADDAESDAPLRASRAALLRHRLDASYAVALATGDPGDDDEEARLDRLVREARRLGAPSGILASRRGAQVLVLVPPVGAGSRDAAAVARALDEAWGGGRVSWGVADRPVPLGRLADGYRLAERALRVGRAVRGRGGVAVAGDLAALLMLADVARDPLAMELARSVLDPLLDYDRATSRGLVKTLETYLAEHGNTTAAARHLHLNRHSLLYRLRRIEELTGRRLAHHEDRYLLDTSLRLLRLGAT